MQDKQNQQLLLLIYLIFQHLSSLNLLFQIYFSLIQPYSTLFQIVESVHAGILRSVTQQFFDSEQLVVLGDTVGS